MQRGRLSTGASASASPPSCREGASSGIPSLPAPKPPSAAGTCGGSPGPPSGRAAPCAPTAGQCSAAALDTASPPPFRRRTCIATAEGNKRDRACSAPFPGHRVWHAYGTPMQGSPAARRGRALTRWPGAGSTAGRRGRDKKGGRAGKKRQAEKHAPSRAGAWACRRSRPGGRHPQPPRSAGREPSAQWRQPAGPRHSDLCSSCTLQVPMDKTRARAAAAGAADSGAARRAAKRQRQVEC